MAACDSLQPVVLLTDVMEPNDRQTETLFGSTTRALFQVEQTEPLNLCLNGTVFEAFTMIDCSPISGENGSFSDQSDDDVIFVKEYKFNGVKRTNGLKVATKGTPRRNPDVSETCVSKNEDSEDWKLESVPRRGKPRKRVINRKMPFRLGRKRKINSAKVDEKKVPLKELKLLFESNLLLLRDYIKDLKIVSKTAKDQKNEESDLQITNAVNMFKQQVKFLSIAKNSDEDLMKFLT
ncbi:uncharacterized protein LOC123012610 isoform X2 [Tribolium madens]|uniref:uncharacterized protein LOC123012610 isoform X2 n=1 Tax=Tribolium madens TaxID=41895 RepID=UPI001CF76057|nr:uncharacterized protein LOC123012610 isoform X2 [Tribolium madens]